MRWCSDACRRRGVTEEDRALESVLRERVAATRAPLDPAEATGTDGEAMRRAARRLAAEGVLDVLQGGRAVDPSTAKGPFRVRRR